MTEMEQVPGSNQTVAAIIPRASEDENL